MSEKKKLFSSLKTLTVGAVAGAVLVASPIAASAGEHGEAACSGKKQECTCQGKKLEDCKKGEHACSGEKGCSGKTHE